MRRELVENMRRIFQCDSIPERADTNDRKRDLCTWFDGKYKEAESLRSAASSAIPGFRKVEAMILAGSGDTCNSSARYNKSTE